MALVVVSVMLCCVGCGQSGDAVSERPTPTRFSGPSAAYRVAWQWSAGPGVDLTSPQAAYVRAVSESIPAATYFDYGAAHPSFEQYLNTDKDAHLLFEPISARETTGASYQLAGNVYTELFMEPGGKDSWYVTLCNYLGGVAMSKNGVPDAFSNQTFSTFTLTRIGEIRGVYPASGPNLYPSADYFTGWTVSQYSDGDPTILLEQPSARHERLCGTPVDSDINLPSSPVPLNERLSVLLNATPRAPTPGWPKGRNGL